MLLNREKSEKQNKEHSEEWLVNWNPDQPAKSMSADLGKTFFLHVKQLHYYDDCLTNEFDIYP